uniref:Uncharacterized protein n=1 Tax=Schizaphis graminum TaxID=13262 RepID=A0A2S2NE25_SCHGA
MSNRSPSSSQRTNPRRGTFHFIPPPRFSSRVTGGVRKDSISLIAAMTSRIVRPEIYALWPLWVEHYNSLKFPTTPSWPHRPPNQTPGNNIYCTRCIIMPRKTVGCIYKQ